MTHSLGTIFNQPTPTLGTHVLLLSHGDYSGIAGIWGPYLSEADAQRALDELGTWPIDGNWTIERLRPYPAPPRPTTPEPTGTVRRA